MESFAANWPRPFGTPGDGQGFGDSSQGLCLPTKTHTAPRHATVHAAAHDRVGRGTIMV